MAILFTVNLVNRNMIICYEPTVMNCIMTTEHSLQLENNLTAKFRIWTKRFISEIPRVFLDVWRHF